MLTDLCEYLKNWFDRDLPKRHATITIKDGKVQDVSDILTVGQYYRIVGSVFNDGVYQYSTDADPNLTDEVFDGAIWTMAVPKRVINLSKDIDDWQAKYGSVDSENMSPYQSESFGGYSYSKGGGSSSDGSSTQSWEDVFKSRLNRWRKV